MILTSRITISSDGLAALLQASESILRGAFEETNFQEPEPFPDGQEDQLFIVAAGGRVDEEDARSDGADAVDADPIE